MQSRDADDDLRLTFYCKDPDSKTATDCASFHRTNRGSWIVQGDAHGAKVAAQLPTLAEGETFVEIPEGLAELFVRRYVEEKYGIDLASAAGRAGQARSGDAEAGAAGQLRD